MTTSEPTTGEIVRALRCDGDANNCVDCRYATYDAATILCDQEQNGRDAADRLESQERDLETLRAFHERYAEQTSKKYVVAVCGLTARAEQAEAQRDEVIADLVLLAGDTNSAIKCGMCKYNPDDTGCELDGSQFDDDGECHFEWRGLPQEGEGL